MQAVALALQERSLHIDRLEAELYPDEEDSKRAPVSAGDDDFTADMKANGLKHTTAGKQELRLTACDAKRFARFVRRIFFFCMMPTIREPISFLLFHTKSAIVTINSGYFYRPLALVRQFLTGVFAGIF
jgi:hypothetical protein